MHTANNGTSLFGIMLHCFALLKVLKVCRKSPIAFSTHTRDISLIETHELLPKVFRVEINSGHTPNDWQRKYSNISVQLKNQDKHKRTIEH